VNLSVSCEHLSEKLAGLQLSGKDIIALLHADGSYLRAARISSGDGQKCVAEPAFPPRLVLRRRGSYYCGSLDRTPESMPGTAWKNTG